MAMNKLLIPFKCSLIILFFSLNVMSTTTKSIGKVKENLYIIGSISGSNYENFFSSNLIDNLHHNFEIVNLSQRNLSIYDQSEIFDELPRKFNILIILEDFYLESILYEIDYKKTICSADEELCKNASYISYDDMYLPLISILHSRLKEMFNYDQQKVSFLLFDKSNTQTEKKIRSIYFEGERNFCLFENNLSIELNAEDIFCY